MDDALAHYVSFRDYGEFYRLAPTTHYQPYFGKALSAALESHIVHNFPGFGFDLKVPDTQSVSFWLKAFNRDVARGTMPQLKVIFLPYDHTGGGAGASPRQEVADSDLATGRIVDAVSHSQYWKSTAIFLTEDDPQSGIDHGDQHRTIGLVVSPWIAAQTRATQHFDQAGMLRTIEEILHLPPMTEFDRTSRPMDALFSTAASAPNGGSYSTITPQPKAMSAARPRGVSPARAEFPGRASGLGERASASSAPAAVVRDTRHSLRATLSAPGNSSGRLFCCLPQTRRTLRTRRRSFPRWPWSSAGHC